MIKIIVDARYSFNTVMLSSLLLQNYPEFTIDFVVRSSDGAYAYIKKYVRVNYHAQIVSELPKIDLDRRELFVVMAGDVVLLPDALLKIYTFMTTYGKLDGVYVSALQYDKQLHIHSVQPLPPTQFLLQVYPLDPLQHKFFAGNARGVVSFLKAETAARSVATIPEFLIAIPKQLIKGRVRIVEPQIAQYVTALQYVKDKIHAELIFDLARQQNKLLYSQLAQLKKDWRLVVLGLFGELLLFGVWSGRYGFSAKTLGKPLHAKLLQAWQRLLNVPFC